MTDHLAERLADAYRRWIDGGFRQNLGEYLAADVRDWLDKGPLRDWSDSDAAAMAASHDDVRVSRQRVREYMQRAIAERRREAGIEGKR